MSTYLCTVISGTRAPGADLSPMLDAWAELQGITLEPGTFNLCADRFVSIPHNRRCELLNAVQKKAPRWRQEISGFAPRLYPVVLNGLAGAWLFRWAERGYLRPFVADTDACRAGKLCEIVAAVHLRTAMEVQDGETVTLAFAGEVA